MSISGDQYRAEERGAESSQESVVSEHDVRAIVRLLGDVAQQTGGVAARKRALMDGLGRLVGADHWIWTISRGMRSGMPMTVGLIHSGFDDEQLAALMAGSQDLEAPPPENEMALTEFLRGEHFTRTRQQWISDERWYGSTHVQKYRQPARMDHFIFSIMPLNESGDDDLISGIGLHREFGREPFTDRDRRIAHIVTSEVPWLHYAELPGEASRQVPALTPRQRTVFGLLIEGKPRRTIATSLGISPHTVNDHVKAIYRHFDVNSRSQLMHRFMSGDGGDLMPPQS